MDSVSSGPMTNAGDGCDRGKQDPMCGSYTPVEGDEWMTDATIIILTLLAFFNFLVLLIAWSLMNRK